MRQGKPWGEATVTCNYQQFDMGLYEPHHDGAIRTRCVSTHNNGAPQDRLEQILLYQLPRQKTEVFFGFKLLGTEYDDYGAEKDWGYWFIEIFLWCTSPDTGELKFQTIVAVKVPRSRNISDHYILKQHIDIRHDRRRYWKHYEEPFGEVRMGKDMVRERTEKRHCDTDSESSSEVGYNSDDTLRGDFGDDKVYDDGDGDESRSAMAALLGD
jgi:hypothetical protein